MTTPFLGAVLAGGASRRMGQPKAIMDLDGQPMGSRVASCLRASGARDVVVVGGQAGWAEALGAKFVPDRWPGEGPLAGLATAVDHGQADEVVVVTACDQPDISPELIGSLIAGLDGAGSDVLASVPVVGREARRQPFPSAWRACAGPLLADLVEAGERRAAAAFGLAVIVNVEATAGELADIDDPSDLARRVAGRTQFGGTRGRS